MSDYQRPQIQIPKWGTPSYVQYMIARDAGIKAMMESAARRKSEAAQLERIYTLPSPPLTL